MTKDPKLYLTHILESVELVEKFTKGMSYSKFLKDQKTYFALLRVLQTLSESAKKLPRDIKNKYDNIRWSDIAGFRNVLVHDYLGGYDDEIIWNVITKELPVLKGAVKNELKKKK